VQKTGEILRYAPSPMIPAGSHLKTITGIALRIKQVPERDVNNFFNLPVGKKPLLAVYPSCHGVDNPVKHLKSLRRQGA